MLLPRSERWLQRSLTRGAEYGDDRCPKAWDAEAAKEVEFPEFS